MFLIPNLSMSHCHMSDIFVLSVFWCSYVLLFLLKNECFETKTKKAKDILFLGKPFFPKKKKHEKKT